MSGSTFFRIACRFCAVVLSASSANVDDFDLVRLQIRDLMSSHKIPSVSVAVADKGKKLFLSRSLGLRIYGTTSAL
jgi:hypothetical protein